MSFSYWLLFVFIAYFAVLIGIAVVRSRRMEAMSDYVLGGRRMSAFTSALSASSSTTSGWTMLALPALGFAAGVLQAWTIVSLVAGVWLAWTFLARRLRRYTIAAGDSLTVPEFFERRFGDGTGVLRGLSGFITVFFIVFYVASGLISGAKLLEVTFGLHYGAGILVTLFAVASYTFIGGFLAVSRTDVFQALIMLAGFLVILVTLFLVVQAPLQGLGETSPDFWNPFTDADGNVIGWVFLFSTAGWGFGALGSQRVLARFMALEYENHIPRARNISVGWLALIYSSALLLGMVALPALAERGMLAEVMQDPELVYLVVTEVFFHPVVAALLLTAVIAAVMSTADSQLLLASAVATDDLPVMKRITYSISTHARVWLGRLLLVIVGIIAAVLSLTHPDSVFNTVSLAWGGMGAAFGPSVILALYWRRFNFWGALASIVAGTVVSTLWWLLPLGAEASPPIQALSGLWAMMQANPGGLWDIQPATPGFIVASLAAIGVTLLTPPPPQEVAELYDRVNGRDLAARATGTERT